MKKQVAALALAAAALLLPGCYFVHHAVPLDASGMDYPLHQFGGQVEDQARRSKEMVTGLPAALGRHCRECWRNLTTDPSDY